MTAVMVGGGGGALDPGTRTSSPTPWPTTVTTTGNDRKALQLSATPPLREEAVAGRPNLDAAVSSSRTRDDRVPSGIWVVSSLIGRFLVLAFAVLYR